MKRVFPVLDRGANSYGAGGNTPGGSRLIHGTYLTAGALALVACVACSSSAGGGASLSDGGASGDVTAGRSSDGGTDAETVLDATASDATPSDAETSADAGNSAPKDGGPGGSADAGSTSSDADGGTPQPVGVSGSWSLIFDDEFDGTALNTKAWVPYWFANGNTANNTVMDSSNVSVSGGSLNLTLTAANTGGLVSTNPSGGASPGFQFTYGYLEARLNLPASGTQIANWPAWWADGQNWPTDGELDVLEGLGGYAAYHFHDPSGGPGSNVNGDYTGWHVFGAQWQAGAVVYYYDGKEVGSITSGITSAPMYLILENSASQPSVRPATMQVDYVRVWQN